MCSELLFTIYALYIQRRGIRILSIERHLTHTPTPNSLSEDDNRNQPAIYAALFSSECRSYMEMLYADAMAQMTDFPFDQSEDLLNCLEFIQEVTATALWRYDRQVGDNLESFARAFDRLDVPSERRRLHDQAQQR